MEVDVENEEFVFFLFWWNDRKQILAFVLFEVMDVRFLITWKKKYYLLQFGKEYELLFLLCIKIYKIGWNKYYFNTWNWKTLLYGWFIKIYLFDRFIMYWYVLFFFFSSYIQYAFLCQLCQFFSLGIKDVIKKIKLFNFSSWIINKNEIERGRKH